MKDTDKVADAIIHAPRDKLIELVAALIAKAAERTKALDAEKARADAAEQMVCELRRVMGQSRSFAMPMEMVARMDAAFDATADIAGRWCPVAERDAAIARAEHEHSEMMTQAKLAVDWMCEAKAAERARDEVQAKHDALRMEIVGAMTDAGVFMLGGDHDPCAPGEVRAAVRKLKQDADDNAKARDEVGIQYAAAQAEIARMKPVVEAAREFIEADGSVSETAMREALAALDTVPGDALATSNVKGGE